MKPRSLHAGLWAHSTRGQMLAGSGARPRCRRSSWAPVAGRATTISTPMRSWVTREPRHLQADDRRRRTHDQRVVVPRNPLHPNQHHAREYDEIFQKDWSVSPD